MPTPSSIGLALIAFRKHEGKEGWRLIPKSGSKDDENGLVALSFAEIDVSGGL